MMRQFCVGSGSAKWRTPMIRIGAQVPDLILPNSILSLPHKEALRISMKPKVHLWKRPCRYSQLQQSFSQLTMVQFTFAPWPALI
jgi:hypothetical protein